MHLTMRYYCACPKPKPGFPTSYVMVYSILGTVKMRGDCSFVEIEGNDHHCVNFFFHN